MMEETIEIEPSLLELNIGMSSKFKIQNTSLHYVAIFIVAPSFYNVTPQIGFIDPCSTFEITVHCQPLQYYQKSNSQIIILSHNIEELEDEITNHVIDWSQVTLNKHYIQTQCFLPREYTQKELNEYEFTIIAEKVSLANRNILSEDEKQYILQYCYKRYGTTKNIQISQTIIIITYPMSNDLVKNMQNDVEIIGNDFVFQVSKPNPLIKVKPKYQLEIASPQFKKQKKEETKKKIITHGQQLQQQSEQQIVIPPPPPSIKASQSTKSKEKKNTPILVEENKEEFAQIIETKQINRNILKEIASFKTYEQSIVHILLFCDLSYLITVDLKNLIKVWNVTLQSEIGVIRDLEEEINFEIVKISEWRLTSEQKKFFILNQTNNIKIYNVENLKFESQVFLNDLIRITCFTQLVDRQFLCVCGIPEKRLTLLGQRMPKYRSLKFFDESLQEIQSFQITCKEENYIINHIVYTENDESQRHSRLNNILILSLGQQNGYGGEIIVIFLDMLNQCTIIMTLTYLQIGIKQINFIEYLPVQSKFALVCDKQTVLLLNIKQIQTQNGLKNGLECKYFEDIQNENEILILNKKELIVRIEGSQFEIIDMKSNQKAQTVLLQQNSLYHMIQAGKILRIENDCILIYELLL